MIKIGCCLNMNAKTGSKIGDESIPLFAKLGFDYIELPLAQVMDLGNNEFNELLCVIRNEGIAAEACNNFFPARVRLTGEDAKLENILEYARAAIDRAAAMGAGIIVLGSSAAKNIPAGFPRDKARDQLKELLPHLDVLVKPFGITITLEPLNSKESNFIVTAAEALSLARELYLDNVKILIDYYHLRMENENPSVILDAGPDLRHLHIACKDGRFFPKPDDGENYAEFFSSLKQINYNGMMSVEGYSNDLASEGAVSLELLRSYQSAARDTHF